MRTPPVSSIPNGERKVGLIVIILTILLACLGLGQTVPTEPIKPTKSESEAVAFETFTKKPEDQIKERIERDTTTFDVISRSGIGGATITLAKGKWPANVILRFHLSGLESLAVSNGKVRLTGSVLSHSGQKKRLYLTEDGKDEEREPGTKIEVLNSAGKAIRGLPDKGGCFQLAVPKVLLDSQPKSLELGWIDFFRR